MNPTGACPGDDEDLEGARERRLIRQARAGNKGAYEDLVRPTLRLLYVVCYRITGDSSIAEDAVQATLLNGWRFIDTFKCRSLFSTWLYKIASRAAVREAQRKRPEPSGDGSELPTPPTPGPEDAVVANLSLQQALMQIPLPQRAAFVMYEWLGMSYAEIAAAQHTTVENIKTRIYRAREKLRGLLGDE